MKPLPVDPMAAVEAAWKRFPRHIRSTTSSLAQVAAVAAKLKPLPTPTNEKRRN